MRQLEVAYWSNGAEELTAKLQFSLNHVLQ